MKRRSESPSAHAPTRTAGLLSVRGLLVGAAIGLLASAAVLLWLALCNPFLVDSLALALLIFVAAPAVAAGATGALFGLLWAVIGRTARSGKRRRSPGLYGAVFAVAVVVALLACAGGRIAAVRAEHGPSEPSLKLLVVGVDGATWRIATPMIENGELPTLALAVDSGASGVLTSLKPLCSPRLFTTIATGKTVDKHGIRGFSDTRADAVLVKRFWDILAERLGWDYGVIEWYVTWPPSASPGGFMVPGWLAAGDETVPPELSFLKKVRRLARRGRSRGIGFYAGIAIDAAVNGARLSTLRGLAGLALARGTEAEQRDIYRRQHAIFVRLITEAACHEIRRTGVEMLAIVYKSTDSLSHKYWGYYEPEAFPSIDPSAVERYGGTIQEVYAAVDREIGRLTRYLSSDGVLVILSDHGFEAERWIYPEMVSFRTETLLRRFGFSLDEVTYINMGDRFYVQPITLDESANAAKRAELTRVFSSIALEETGAKAFAVENIDKEGTGDDYVEVTVTEDLRQIASDDPLLMAEDGTSMRLSDFLTVMDRSGGHATDGVIVLAGKPFAAGARIEGATILDVTPTILASLGLPVAQDMDGRALSEAMTREFLSDSPVGMVETYETEVRQPQPSATIGSMPEELRDRLRSLGYVQ